MFDPALTLLADGVLVITRSACIAVATVVLVTAVLFVLLVSVAELTVTVSVMVVPAGVPALTCTASVKVVDPGTRLAIVHVSVPVPPTTRLLQAHPAGGVNDRKFVFAGIASVNVTLAALLGPGLVRTCVYVMLFPAITGSGLSTFVIDKSALVPTAILELALLLPGLGSPVTAPTVTVSLIRVPSGVLVFTLTVTTKVALTPLFKVPIVHVIAPVAPTAGVAHAQPTGTGRETNVVFAGVAPETLTAAALAAPPLVAICV